MKSPLVILRLPAPLKERLERIAKTRGAPLSAVVRAAVLEWVDREQSSGDALP